MGDSYRLVKAGALHAEAERGLSQRVSAALSSVVAGTTLLVLGMDDRTVSRWFVSPGSDDKHRAFALARALGARSEAEAVAPDLRGGALARLEWVPSASDLASAGTVVGSPQALSDALDEALLPGEWVAMSLRSPAAFERGRWRRWLTHQRQTMASHHSAKPNALVVSLWASAGSNARAAELVSEVSAALVGFDLVVPAVPVTKGSTRRVLSAAVLGSAAAAAAMWVVPGLLPAEVATSVDAVVTGVHASAWDWLSWLRWVVSGAAGVVAVWWFLSLVGVAPDGWSRIQSVLAHGRVPSPPQRFLPPRAPREATTRMVGQGEDRHSQQVAARDGDYPLASSSFVMGAELPAGLALPGSSVRAGAESTRERTAPPALLQPVGPEVGAQGGVPVHLSRADLFAGVFAIGRPSSGKTQLLEWLVAESLRDESFASVATVAFDTKGDSEMSRQLVRWGEWAGRKVRRIRLADPQVQLALDIFGGGSVADRVGRVIAAMKYVEGAGVGPQTEETLRTVLPLALLVDDGVADATPGVEAGRSSIYYAHVLAGGLGDDAAVALFEAVAAGPSHAGLEAAVQGAQVLFGRGISPSTRKAQSSSARNKLSSMVQVDHFWAAGEADGAPDWAVIFGGEGRRARHVVFDFAGLDESVTADVAKFLLFRLRQGIVEHCGGFERQRRVVQVLSDEVKAIAADASDVVSWFRSDGRSFGVRALFATQFPDQLAEQVRRSLLGFGTLIAFGQDDAMTATQIAAQVSKESAPWSKDDVETLPRFTAIVYTLLDQQRQPAFTVQVPYFAGRELGE